MNFDPNKPVRTRDGRKAVILSKDDRRMEGGGYVYTIRAEVEHPNDPKLTVRWNYLPEGRWKSNEDRNPNDLVNERIWHRWLGVIAGWAA